MNNAHSTHTLTLTGGNWAAIANALRVAAETYDLDAKGVAHTSPHAGDPAAVLRVERVEETFRRQAAEARRLSDWIENEID